MPFSPGAAEVQGTSDAGQPPDGFPVPVQGVAGGTPVGVSIVAGGGPTAVTIADGADTAEGTTTDAAVTGDSPGTISGKLRGLVKILTNVWDSVNARLNVAVQNIVSVAQSGVWNVGLNAGSNTIGKVDQGLGGASAWKVDGSGVTQPVSGTVTALQGTNPWIDDVTDRAARKLGQVFLRNPGDTVNLGDAANPMRVDPTGATIQPVSGTVTANQGAAGAASWPFFIPGVTFPDVKLLDGRNTVPTFDDRNRRLLELVLLEIQEVRRILED